MRIALRRSIIASVYKKRGLAMDKKYIRTVFIFTTALIITLMSSMAASAEVKPKDQFMWGENYYFNTYLNWTSTPVSYLVPVENGYMRVQAGNIYTDDVDLDHGDLIGIEYYDNAFNRIGKKYKIIEPELTRFGGFCAYGDYYYIVSGNYNDEESDNVEVFRITKYDKNWNRVASASMYGENTYSPFSYGSISFAGSGNILIVHTCHQMYKLSDGLNHQTNMSFYVDVNKMDALKPYNFGYVSHSFNQLIRVEGGTVVTADHGDGGPRGIELNIYVDKDPSKFTASIDRNTALTIMEFAEQPNYRVTKANIGSLQISDTSYLVAGKSIDQSNGENGIYNVFVDVVDKKSHKVELKWLTDYPKGCEKDALNPYLVKISGNRFLLMWNEGAEYGKNAEKNEVLKCVYLNAEGDAVSEVYELNGILSDCEPIIKDGHIVWYSYNAPKITFYKMPASDPSQMKVVTRKWKKPSNITIDVTNWKIKVSNVRKYPYFVWAFTWNAQCPERTVKVTAKAVNKKSRKALKYIKKNESIRINKGTKKGTYKMKITVKAKGTKTYLPEKKSAVVTIKVK